MGVVYLARDLRLKRLVALKMIRPGRELSRKRLERFLAEARVVAQFQHPNVVQIYDIRTHEGQPFFPLEYLEGGSLGRKLAGMPQPAKQATGQIEILARAVETAHQKNIIHRDLKPSNILLAADGTLKIADFGLAKQLDQDSAQTEEEGILGTPCYMAPEQAWGNLDQVGKHSDIYALGVILYEMLTGRPPFQGSDKWQTVLMVRSQEPVPPRRLVPQVPRDLELICLRCLQKDPRKRFPSALELAEDLRRFQEGRPIKTRPTPFWERAWKWTRRNKAVASLLAASLAALVTLLLYLDQRARMVQRELQEQQRTSHLRFQVQDLHLQAQEASDKGNLEDAQGKLAAALLILQDQSALHDLKPSLLDLRQEVSRREVVRRGEKEANETFQQFFRLRDDALFHGMVFTGVDLPANVAATKEACRKALNLFGITMDLSRKPVFPASLAAQQKQQCTAGIYELLLIWAEAEAQPNPGQRVPKPSQLKEALRLLDQAEKLEHPPLRAYHQRRAGYLEGLGENADAQRERQLANTVKPAGALDYFLTGDAHQKQGKLAEAIQDFAHALAYQPDHFWARYFLAVCHLQLQKSAQARDNLTACLMSRPDFLWLYILRGFAHGQLNDFRAAQRDFEQALALKPDPQAHYGILVNQGELVLRQAKLAEGWPPMPWLFPQFPNLEFACRGAGEMVRAERLATAAQILQEAIRLKPDQFAAYRYLALVKQQQKKLEEATGLVNRAIEAARGWNPMMRGQLYGQRARLYREGLKLDLALGDLDRALDAFPTGEDHAERGRILHIRHQHQDALEAYDAALRLRPDLAEVHRWKGEALLTLHRTAEAALSLDHYLAAGGRPSADIFRTRGTMRAWLKEFPGALADYTQALAMEPDAGTHAARGWVFLANEVLPLALQDFEETIRLDPNHAEAYTGRGLIRLRQGKQDQAIADADKAVAIANPKTPRLLWNAAHIYAQVVAHLAIQKGTQTPQAIAMRTRYQDHALDLLRRALLQLPEPERPRFWRQFIATDPLLQPLRGAAGFDELERKFGRTVRKSNGPV